MPVPNRNVSSDQTTKIWTTWVPDVGQIGARQGPYTGSTTRSFWDVYIVSSVKTAHFNELKRFQLPVNNYSKQTILMRDPQSAYTQKVYQTGGYTLQEYLMNGYDLGVRVGMDDHRDAAPDDLTQKVTSKIIEQLKLGQAQTGVALAEFGKTAAHLAHTATRIANALRALRKGRFGDFTSALGITASRRQTDRFYTGLRKNSGVKGKGFRYDKRFKASRDTQESRYHDFLASTWLEYQYGWRPLLSDVYDHAKAFATVFIDYNGHWRTVTARGKSQRITSKDTGNGAQYKVVYQITWTNWLSMRVDYRIPNGVVNPLNIFGLNNPLTVVWEVVPFSFVVDWFIPIGNALEALTAYSGLEFIRGSKTSRVAYLNTGVVKSTGKRTTGSSPTECTVATQVATHNEFGMSRSLMNSFPAFGLPHFKDPRSVKHAASALALLQSLWASDANRRLKLR